MDDDGKSRRYEYCASLESKLSHRYEQFGQFTRECRGRHLPAVGWACHEKTVTPWSRCQWGSDEVASEHWLPVGGARLKANSQQLRRARLAPFESRCLSIPSIKYLGPPRATGKRERACHGVVVVVAHEDSGDVYTPQREKNIQIAIRRSGFLPVGRLIRAPSPGPIACQPGWG